MPTKPDREAARRAEELVLQFQATGDAAIRAAVVTQYWGCLVAQANAHPAKAYVSVAELVSYGADGMLNAIRLWKPGGASFGLFLKQKIYFAIKDGLRSMCQSTRTQRTRGTAKSFSRLSALGTEGAREHAAFDEFERMDEYTAVVERAPLSWLERVVLRLTHREGWSPDWIAEALSLDEGDVKRCLKALASRLGDGTEEIAPKAPKTASLRYRAKQAMLSAEREWVVVLRDVAAMRERGQQKTVEKLLRAAWQRRACESYPHSAAMVERIAATGRKYGVALLPICM